MPFGKGYSHAIHIGKQDTIEGSTLTCREHIAGTASEDRTVNGHSS